MCLYAKYLANSQTQDFDSWSYTALYVYIAYIESLSLVAKTPNQLEYQPLPLTLKPIQGQGLFFMLLLNNVIFI
jgi:hypothetical protein